MSQAFAVLLLVLATVTGVQSASFPGQSPFSALTTGKDAQYRFEWPIREVAIIGAGVSGLSTYANLKKTGKFDRIRIFERDDQAGGNWHYTDEVPNTVYINSSTADDWWKGDFVPSSPADLPLRRVYDLKEGDAAKREELEARRREHRAPKPIWKSLESNTPAVQQQIPQYPWPPHTPWSTHQTLISGYLRAFASWTGINAGDGSPDTEYSTRVERIDKRFVEGKHQGWTLLLSRFVKLDADKYTEDWWTEDFDAVVVASGRFNVPWTPPIEGLAQWQERFPDRIVHSRQYRGPEPFSGENVIVVGASSSATEIARDVNPVVKTNYISIRPGSGRRGDVFTSRFLSRLPSNTTVIGEIKAFHPLGDNESLNKGIIELVNGTNLTGVDRLIFGTGYRYAFPFLPQYHNSSVKGEEIPDVEEQPIVTDGTHVRSLFLDIFYIDQPTIAFQCQNVGIQSFSYSQYISAAIAKVWSGEAKLPAQEYQWDFFWSTVKQRGGLKKGFQWLYAAAEWDYLKYIVAWLNDAAYAHRGEFLALPRNTTDENMMFQRSRFGTDWIGRGNSAVDLGQGPTPAQKDYSSAYLHDW